MYGLKNNVDLSFLRNKTLLQICIGLTEVILNFDEQVAITILTDFSISIEDGQKNERFDDLVLGATALLALLHDVVVEAKTSSSGGLMLSFQSGAIIELFDTSAQYESFWLANGNDLIIV